MKFKLMILALSLPFIFTGCSNSAQLDELNTKIEEQAKALTDTVEYFNEQMMGLTHQIDSLNMLLHPSSTTKQTTSGGKKADEPKKDPGKVDVTKKGGSDEDGNEKTIDVTKKGGTDSEGKVKKIDVTKKGSKGSKSGGDE